MTPAEITLIVCAILLADVLIILLVARFAKNALFTPLANQFPPKGVGPGAEEREFCSARVKQLNFGGCLHIAVDDHFVHIAPALLMRIVGASATSVPLELVRAAPCAVELTRTRQLTEGVIGPIKGLFPAWVFVETAARIARAG